MALDAVVFPQDPFGNINCSFKDYFQGMEEDDEIICGTIGGFIDTQYSWSYDQLNSCIKDQWEEPNSNSSPEVFHGVVHHQIPIEKEQEKDQPVTTQRKRRRTKMNKNMEEVENQRKTHIAVERNRRKQMNEYLAVLRSLMPPSYAQRGDQASIIGGAINFVKELEQLLQTLEAEKTTKNHHQQQLQARDQPQQEYSLSNLVSPFAHFLTLPQYTTSQPTGPTSSTSDGHKVAEDGSGLAAAAADIEVTVVESHANVKILVKKRSKQLVKIVNAFQNLKLTVQHLNVSSLNHMVLYSTSVKIEDGCKFNSVDEIAAAVNQMLHNIEEDRVCADEFSYNM